LIPEGTAGLIAFLVFVAPGAAFVLVWDWRRPGRVETSLREANRLVLVSLASWVPPLLVLGLVRLQWPAVGETLIRSLVGGDQWRDEPVSAALQAAALASAAILIAILGAWAATRRNPADMRSGNTWHHVLRHVVPEGGVPFLWVTLSSGVAYGGAYVAGKTGEIPPQERELILGQPLRLRVGQAAPVPVPGSYVALSGHQIASMTVTYMAKADVEAAREAKEPRGS
jgi:hypothetical protein